MCSVELDRITDMQYYGEVVVTNTIQHNRNAQVSKKLLSSTVQGKNVGKERTRKMQRKPEDTREVPESTAPPLLPLTLVGLAVSGDQVLQLETVGSHLLLCLTANGRHVAVLHLASAAARTGLDTHTEGIIWKTQRKHFHPEEVKYRPLRTRVKSLQKDFYRKYILQ